MPQAPGGFFHVIAQQLDTRQLWQAGSLGQGSWVPATTCSLHTPGCLPALLCTAHEHDHAFQWGVMHQPEQGHGKQGHGKRLDR